MTERRIELISRYPSRPDAAVPLLFVHGAFHAAWCWDVYFLDYFAARGFASHAMSFRGHGSSDGRRQLRRTRLADYVDDVAAAVEQLPKPPILIGHSLGGLVVGKYLEDHAAPAAVFLAAPPPSRRIVPIWRVVRRHPVVFAKVNLTLSLRPLVATPQLARESLFSDDMPEAKVVEYWRRLQDESFTAFFDLLVLTRVRPAKVTTPLLVLGGARDSLISPREVDATARAYGAQSDIIADVAHDMMLDCRWEAVAARIHEWLRPVAARAATRAETASL